MSYDCDVLVLGGGAAGLTAAIVAADQGASVVVFEAGERTGGSAALSSGVVYAANTSVQRAKGIEDSAEAMFRYCMTLNQGNLQPDLIKRMAEESGPALDWLIGLGAEFTTDALFTGGIEDVSRSHMATGLGTGLVKALTSAAIARGVEIHTNIRVKKLLVENGRVCGIEVDDDRLRAPAVVLASGGFAANPEMLAQYVPHLVKGDDWWKYSVAGETSQGDAMRMGQDVSAAIVGEGIMTPPHLTPKFSRNLSDYHPSWMMMVNNDGHRFMSETSPYSVSGHLTEAQPGGICHIILDEAARASSDTSEPLAALAAIHGGDYVYTGERILEELELGHVHRADTVEELAEKLGVPAAALAEQVRAYNADVAAGEDTTFFKQGELKPISTAPYYGITLYPASFGGTCTGLRIDRESRVLDVNGAPIAGLFAAGEAAGGLLGQRYAGSGINLCGAITYGRISGSGAAALAAEQSVPAIPAKK
jgi:fumarate reductase flavoprotein subunit